MIRCVLQKLVKRRLRFDMQKSGVGVARPQSSTPDRAPLKRALLSHERGSHIQPRLPEHAKRPSVLSF